MSRSDVLVDADWVEAHIGTPGVVIVEVDEDASAYDKGHIPTAVKVDWKKDLQDPVRRDFVDKTGFEALLSGRGVSNDDTVVLYGGNNNWFAAYAYWYFRLYGHRNVKLLDGGRKTWELDSRELSTDVPERAKTSYTASEQDASLRALRDEVLAAIGKMPPTVVSRSVQIKLKRLAVGETVERLRLDRLDHLKPLAQRAARWAIDHIEQLRDADPEIPPTPSPPACR